MTVEQKKAAGVLSAAVLLAGAAFLTERSESCLAEGGRLARREYGAGDYEAYLTFTAGELGDFSYTLTVPEQKLTETVQRALIEAAEQEIQNEFPGENESAECIRDAVCIRGSYQEGRVLAEWSFDNYDVMDEAGNVIGTELPGEGVLVNAAVELQCGDSVVWKELAFRVFPAAVPDDKTRLLRGLEKEILRQANQSGTEYITLPEEMGGYELAWKEQRSDTAAQILLLGLVLAALLPLAERSRRREREKKRLDLLESEYPELVNKMALLLGAGMTPSAAWKKIALVYEEKRRRGKCPEMPAYEEMLTVCHEIESGIGEQRAYEEFGNRCGVRRYRRFANILAQNLRKGSAGLLAMLEAEAENSFEERKRTAKRYGEEASTKLLGPMLLMLGIVIVILAVPAAVTFQF